MTDFLLLGIYYGSYLIFPILVLYFWCFYKTRKRVYLFVLVLSLLFTWARFIESQLIFVKTQKIEAGFDAKIALIADLHLGIYKNKNFLERVVKQLNQKEIDMVLIAGDLTYEPKEQELKHLLAPLKKIKFPVYAVLGNHDVGFPGPPIRQTLVKILEENNVNVLENEIVNFDKFKLVGLGSHFAGEDDVNLLYNFDLAENIIVLAHNPDTTSRYYKNNVDLTLSGHTHGGQIRIPWLYKKVIPTEGDFDKGFSQEQRTKLFVTSGLGEVGLPMRLFNPPEIVVLDLN